MRPWQACLKHGHLRSSGSCRALAGLLPGSCPACNRADLGSARGFSEVSEVGVQAWQARQDAAGMAGLAGLTRLPGLARPRDDSNDANDSNGSNGSNGSCQASSHLPHSASTSWPDLAMAHACKTGREPKRDCARHPVLVLLSQGTRDERGRQNNRLSCQGASKAEEVCTRCETATSTQFRTMFQTPPLRCMHGTLETRRCPLQRCRANPGRQIQCGYKASAFRSRSVRVWLQGFAKPRT